MLKAVSVSDYTGVGYALAVLADKGYDAAWLRTALRKSGEHPLYARSSSRKPEYYDKKLYQKNHKIGNMFARLKD